jgi:hypothetical protein
MLPSREKNKYGWKENKWLHYSAMVIVGWLFSVWNNVFIAGRSFNHLIIAEGFGTGLSVLLLGFIGYKSSGPNITWVVIAAIMAFAIYGVLKP